MRRGDVAPALLVLHSHAVGDGYLLLRPSQGLVGEGLLAEVVEGVEALLCALQEHRRVVDAAVLGVILLRHLGQVHAAAAAPLALHLVGMQGERVGQVDDVARLSVLEQGGIALGGDLLYLPLHGRQQHLILARQHVGHHHHAVALGVHVGGVVVPVGPVGLMVCIDGVARGERAVGVVEYQPRSVVALQGEHEFQAVAQVVGREGVAQWQFALHVAACHAADEFHALGVVEVGVGHVGLEVHLLLAVPHVVAIVGEGVVLHHGLHFVRSAQHAEGELTLEVALHDTSRRAHLVLVHHEACTAYGDAGALVHDESREPDTGGDGEVAVLLVVRPGVEGDVESALAVLRKVVVRYVLIGHGDLVGTLLVAPVAKVFYTVEARLVGLAGGWGYVLLGAGGRHGDLDAGYARAVGEAHIAFHLARLDATACHFGRRGLVQALALVDRRDAVLVVEHGRHGLVLILLIGHLRGYDLPRTFGEAASLHPEVVYGVLGLLPRQQYAALTGLRL